MKLRWFASIVCALAAVFGVGQSSVPSINPVQAIVNARIEIGDGRVIEKGNVVIRDGVIVAVGLDAPVPKGAEVLDGAGLTVYPGFIDSFTNKGLKLPDAKPEQDSPASFSEYTPAFMREANRQGVRPELRASQFLDLSDDFLKPYRAAGFTNAHIVPPGFIGGVGAVVNLGGRPTRDTVIANRVAMGFSFAPVGGGFFGGPYPDSLIGRIAQIRQTLYDAQWQQSLTVAWAAGGTKRPPADDALEALAPVLGKQMPALFEVDKPSEVDRVLSMVSEFGLRPIITGGTQGWKRAQALKERGIPLILTMSFGKEPGAKPDGEPPKTPDDPGDQDVDPARTGERHRLWLESVRNAAELSKGGIPIGLSSKGTKDINEFMANLRTAVKNGLTRDVALKALTSDAARILGVDRSLGAIEVGKIANVVALTGDFLDPKVKVQMVYIDGRKLDPSRTPVPAAPRSPFSTHGEGR